MTRRREWAGAGGRPSGRVRVLAVGRGAAAGGRALRGVRAGGLARDIYLVLSCRAPWHVSAAPRSVARQTLPRHRSAARSSPRHPSHRATMHGAAQAFRRVMAIGAAKSVSFGEKKLNSVRFKISLQKVLKKSQPVCISKPDN